MRKRHSFKSTVFSNDSFVMSLFLEEEYNISYLHNSLYHTRLTWKRQRNIRSPPEI